MLKLQKNNKTRPYTNMIYMFCLSVKFGPPGNVQQLEGISDPTAKVNIWTWVAERLRRPEKTEYFCTLYCLMLLW